jgi:hypothetical protein
MQGDLLMPQDEEWRATPGFSGYEVSSIGRIRRSLPGNRTYVGRILKLQTHKFGYPHANLTRDGKHVGIEVHRLVALAFIGPQPTAAHQVAHWDNDPANCRRENLRWATAVENNNDKERFGTAPIGSRNGSAKLSEADIIEIRRLRAGGEKLAAIGDRFGVAFQTVSKIINGDRWGHVNGLEHRNGSQNALSGG